MCGECKKCKHAAYMREWYRKKSMAERRAWMALRDPEKTRANHNAYHRRHAGEPVHELKRRARVRLQERRP